MKISWQVLLLGVASLALGAWLNDIVYKRNNEKLLAQLKAELAAGNVAKARASSPAERIALEQNQIKIEAQIELLNSL